MEAMGSYCRGRPSCGDMDFLIFTLEDTVPPGKLMPRLLAKLRADGFLTDDMRLPCEEVIGQRMQRPQAPPCRHPHRRCLAAIPPSRLSSPLAR